MALPNVTCYNALLPITATHHNQFIRNNVNDRFITPEVYESMIQWLTKNTNTFSTLTSLGDHAKETSYPAPSRIIIGLSRDIINENDRKWLMTSGAWNESAISRSTECSPLPSRIVLPFRWYSIIFRYLKQLTVAFLPSLRCAIELTVCVWLDPACHNHCHLPHAVKGTLNLTTLHGVHQSKNQ